MDSLKRNEIYDDDSPRHAVCCKVLNLQKQGGILFTSAALTEVYRITCEMWFP